MNSLAVLGPSFVREHLRTRLTLVLLVLILNVGARLLAKLFQPKAR